MNSSVPESSVSIAEGDAAGAVPLILNLDALRDRCLGNDALVAQILGKLATSVRLQCERLIAAWSEYDFAGVAAMAHHLKGTAANVGAESLAQAASQLEAAARQGETQETSQGILRLEQEVRRLTESMHRNPEI